MEDRESLYFVLVYHLLYWLLDEVVDVRAQQIRFFVIEYAVAASLFDYILRKEHHENIEVFELYPLDSASNCFKKLLDYSAD